MIDQVIALPKMRMLKLKDEIETDTKYIVVSIIDPEPNVPVIFTEDTERIITVRFSDMTPAPFHHCHFDFNHERFCSSADALKIVEHILFHANSDEHKILLVNCSAGICRSGAVVTWALKHSGMKDTDFIAKNPCIQPNQWVFEKCIEAEMSLNT